MFAKVIIRSPSIVVSETEDEIDNEFETLGAYFGDGEFAMRCDIEKIGELIQAYLVKNLKASLEEKRIACERSKQHSEESLHKLAKAQEILANIS